MATSLNLAECTPKFGTEKHLEHPETLQYLNATLTHSVFGQLATARCLKILGRMRFKNTGDFLEIMDEESEELHGFNFSVGLFDQYSDIRPWLVDGGARSGSGCWGTELSVGDMMYIEEVRVKEGVCFFPCLVLVDINGRGFSSSGDVVLARCSLRKF